MSIFYGHSITGVAHADTVALNPQLLDLVREDFADFAVRIYSGTALWSGISGGRRNRRAVIRHSGLRLRSKRPL